MKHAKEVAPEASAAAPHQPRAVREADNIVDSSAQQVLDAIAKAVVSDAAEPGSALAPIHLAREDYAVVVRPGPKASPGGSANDPERDERAVLDDLASASDDLKSVVKRIRKQFLRLADIEIRKTLALTGPDFPVQARDPATSTADASFTPSFDPRTVVSPDEGPAWDPASATPGEIYEGTVLLLVMADGDVQRIVQFVDELCQMPQFRMLRMTGSRGKDGAEISLGLREPLPFRQILESMPNVVRVDVRSPGADGGGGVTVHLAPVAPDEPGLAPLDLPVETEA